RAHPLRTVVQELQRHGQCAELPLAYLPETGVAAYLAARSPGRPLPEGLAWLLHQRTDGNPLFLVSVVDAMVRQVVLQEDGAGRAARVAASTDRRTPRGGLWRAGVGDRGGTGGAF